MMSSITTLFFAASSFSCRDPISFSRLKLLHIPLILAAIKFSVVTRVLPRVSSFSRIFVVT